MVTKSVAIVTGVLAVATLAAQQKPTFRSGVSTVSIYATVRADDGSLVTDLTKDDFEVRDDGKIRDVTVFSSEIVPITVAMMLDMSGSQEQGVEWMREAAYAFVDQLLPADRARIGTFGMEIAISPRLTGDRAYLRRVLAEEIWPGGGTPLWEALAEAMSSLAAASGRRVILALTDGIDSTPSSQMSFTPVVPGPGGKMQPISIPGWSGGLDGGAGAVTIRAMRENFMIYGVGHAMSRRAASSGSMSGPAMEGALSEQMKSLATDSGGGFRVFAPGQDAKDAMVQVAEELHRQYLIGFTPVAIDNKVHKLNVKVKRPGMSVQARKNYLADGK
jgi:Ca-activated chloride channel family protein